MRKLYKVINNYLKDSQCERKDLNRNSLLYRYINCDEDLIRKITVRDNLRSKKQEKSVKEMSEK